MKAAWEAKAQEVKRIHAENNPEYQYQPRKPSDKKRRMTKKKLAKRSASHGQAGSPSSEDTPSSTFSPEPVAADSYTPATDNTLQRQLPPFTISGLDLGDAGPEDLLVQHLLPIYNNQLNNALTV